MAKADPKKLKKEGEELKALFAKIKKKQHNCAILVAKDGVVIEAHIKKSPEVLMKLAKKNGGTAKGAWGTITMDGAVLILDPINDKVPSTLPKLCKSFFGARGVKNRLEIKEPDDTASQADGAIDPLAAVDNAVDENTQKAEALKARLDKLAPKIDAVIKAAEKLKLYENASNDTAGSLKAARQELLSAIEKGDFAIAENILGAIPASIAAIEKDIAEKTADTNRAEALKARLDKLAPKIDAVIKAAEKLKLYENASNDTAGSLKAARQELLSAIEKGDFAIAENILGAIPASIAAIEKDIAAFKAKQADGDDSDSSSKSEDTSDSGERNVLDDLVVQGVSDERKAQMKKFDEAQAKQKKTMARWLERNKQDINIVLKDKKSKYNKDLVKWISAYKKLLKADRVAEAQQALDEVALVLKAYAKDFKLSSEQKSEIFAELDKIKDRLSKLMPNI